MLTSSKAISEDRTITREKYSELKLEAEWLKVSTDYLTAQPGAALVWTYATNAAITVTRLGGNSTLGSGSFYVVRHSDYSSTTSDNYTMKLPTLEGDISIPTLVDTLTLHGRDSKIVVTDYDVRGIQLSYSTAEIFTHQRFENATVLVVYTGPDETNELAVKVTSSSLVVPDSVRVNRSEELITLAWATSPTRRIVQIDDLYIYILGIEILSHLLGVWLMNKQTGIRLIIIGCPKSMALRR